MPRFGSQNICPRCGKAVYFAEQKMVLGKAWHKTCYKCAACNKSLMAVTQLERNGQIFCKSCYGKNFAPRGYGYGGGAGALSSYTGEKPLAKTVPKTAPPSYARTKNRFSRPAPARPAPAPRAAANACFSCGTELKMGAKFCTNCGANQTAPKPKPKPKPPVGFACSQCGTAAKPGQKFCTECGGRVVGAAAPAPPRPTCCSGCGSAYKPGQKFCTSCGNKLI